MRAATLLAAATAVAAQGYGPINNLPGWNSASGPAMWSGYVTVNATAGRALFFWFVQSSNPSANTITTWTNGGPGCSSLGGGLFSEHGPFRPDPAGSGGLVANPWSWHTVSHMLYVEQPAGVGFSYSNTTSDYTTGDAQSAADYYAFLQGWLSLPEFQQYRALPLYASGESYGGHYVPNLAAYITQQNLNNPEMPKINLAGFVLGNAWTDAGLDNTGCVEMWYWHGIISNDTRNGILATCNMSGIGPLLSHSRSRALDAAWDITHTYGDVTLRHGAMGLMAKVPQRGADGRYVEATYKAKSCNDYQNDANNMLSYLDIYNLYGNNANGCPAEAKALAARKRGGQAAHAAAIADSNVPAGCSAEYDVCIDGKTGTYLNRADVQAAIHVVPSLIPGGTWVGCSGVVNYSYNDLLSSMLPVYTYLLTAAPASSRWLVFSGDIDGIVPFTGTRMWLDALSGLNLTNPQHYYLTGDGQVAGFSYGYTYAATGAQLTFATVRNAGHLVPTTQGSRGLQLFTTWLSGQYP